MVLLCWGLDIIVGWSAMLEFNKHTQYALSSPEQGGILASLWAKAHGFLWSRLQINWEAILYLGLPVPVSLFTFLFAFTRMPYLNFFFVIFSILLNSFFFSEK